MDDDREGTQPVRIGLAGGFTARRTLMLMLDGCRHVVRVVDAPQCARCGPGDPCCDALLLDFAVPACLGDRIVALARAHCRAAIVLVGGGDAAAHLARTAGADGYVHRNAGAAELLAAVRSAIGRRTAAPGRADPRPIPSRARADAEANFSRVPMGGLAADP